MAFSFSVTQFFSKVSILMVTTTNIIKNESYQKNVWEMFSIFPQSERKHFISNDDSKNKISKIFWIKNLPTFANNWIRKKVNS